VSRWGVLALPARYWARQSLRARLTLLATALFALTVATGAILVIVLQRYALTRVLDSAALDTANNIAAQVKAGNIPNPIVPNARVIAVQVLRPDNTVETSSAGADFATPELNPQQQEEVREGRRFDITSPTSGQRVRALGVAAGRYTVVVLTDVAPIEDSVRVLTRAALIGGPIAVLLVGLSTYFVVALTLRSVAALRHGAADITAARLSGQRLPVPSAQDEIHRLAVTLNEMLDRLETATSRQRTFVGDAAHELRSPLASLRVQLEVAQRIGPDGDWDGLVDDVLVDLGRLDRLVEDLLSLARLDETATATAKREPVDLADLVDALLPNYAHARVPVVRAGSPERNRFVVSGDRDRLRRIVVNLVDNAVRYAHTHVAIGLAPTTGSADHDGRGRDAPARAVLLTVTDDGPGLPEAERERVFDRFYRAEFSRSRESGGTGLGLPIVRNLVRAHQGTVELRARPDGAEGLQAVVILPLAHP
jgi:signal transduction histidine kinase